MVKKMDECDEQYEDEWPTDDEANDIMLAYEATEELDGSRSGCAGVVLLLLAALTVLMRALIF